MPDFIPIPQTIQADGSPTSITLFLMHGGKDHKELKIKWISYFLKTERERERERDRERERERENV